MNVKKLLLVSFLIGLISVSAFAVDEIAAEVVFKVGSEEISNISDYYQIIPANELAANALTKLEKKHLGTNDKLTCFIKAFKNSNTITVYSDKRLSFASIKKLNWCLVSLRIPLS